MNIQVKVIFLYTELADYFLACLKELENHVDEIHVIHWPIRGEAPFVFKVPDNVFLHKKPQTGRNSLIFQK